MFILDSLLIGSLRFVLDKIVAAAEAESQDDTALREQLLEAQMQLELGDISEAELVGIYLDVAALSVALDGKPLTVRVMPVTGAVAGEPTRFEFEYFASSRVLVSAGAGALGVLERGE